MKTKLSVVLSLFLVVSAIVPVQVFADEAEDALIMDVAADEDEETFDSEETLETYTEEDMGLLQAASDSYTVKVSGTHNYDMADTVMSLLNKERQKLGLEALVLDKELSEAAMQRAAELSVFYSHTRPDGSSCFTICDKLNGENIASGFESAEDVFWAWKNSPSHYENMTRDWFRSVGIGHFRYQGTDYWVQSFSEMEAEQTEIKTGVVNVTRTVIAGESTAGPEKIPDVLYDTHVQSIGWQDPVMNGEMSGTEGRSLRLEAIGIWIDNSPYEGGVEYRTHVQTYGWQKKRRDGEMAGTSGESKRLEAIQINLTGELSEHYDIWYQTHIQNFGWSGWASNGAQCGSAGYSYRLEGIRIKLVKKGDPAPGSTVNPFYQKAGAPSSDFREPTGALVGYNTHVQTYGWQPFVYDGDMAGTQGESKRLEGIHIELVDQPYYGDIVYSTHIQTYGWDDWVANGMMSGTSGESKRLEGIQIFLTDEMAEHYDVYYCVHAQTYGWLDWAKNGIMAGTSGLSKRLEGIRIVLVEKGGKAPGSTARPYVIGSGGSLPDNPYIEP